jgi:hypothetical protein
LIAFLPSSLPSSSFFVIFSIVIIRIHFFSIFLLAFSMLEDQNIFNPNFFPPTELKRINVPSDQSIAAISHLPLTTLMHLDIMLSAVATDH